MTNVHQSVYTVVCDLDELTDGEPASAQIGDALVVLVRLGDDVFALADRCSHANVALSDGLVEDCAIECFLHGSRFDLRTGHPDRLPATEPVATYPTRVADGQVLIAMPPETPTER